MVLYLFSIGRIFCQGQSFIGIYPQLTTFDLDCLFFEKIAIYFLKEMKI